MDVTPYGCFLIGRGGAAARSLSSCLCENVLRTRATHISFMADIRRAARELIEQYGEKAASAADNRAEIADGGTSRAAGDLWRQVAAAIREVKGRSL
jgi:hypothetical protein